MTKREYFGYIRVSTKKQGDGASLPEQKAAIHEYAARHDLAITRWFIEKHTAAKTGRQQFAELIRELRRRRAAGLVVYKVDRGARNLHDWATFGDLVDDGIDVRFVVGNVDMTTRGGRLMADFEAIVAADFSRNNRAQVKLCMYGWVKQGYYPWPAPIGYENQGKHRFKSIDPIRGPLVVRAFEAYDAGDHSLDSLRLEIAAWGLTGATGKPLDRSAVAKMLRNPFYCGLIRVRGELYDGKHTPLISMSLFDRVQARIDGRVYPKASASELRFRRLIQCAGCRRTLTGERQKGRVYYRCHSKACRGVSVSEAHIEAHVVGPTIGVLGFDDGEMGDIRDILRELVAESREAEIARLTHVELQLAKTDERLTRLTDALLDGIVDRATHDDRKARLLQDRKRWEEARDASKADEFGSDLLKRFELGNAASNLYFLATEARKRELLNSLGSNFVARGKELEFSMSFPFPEIVEARKNVIGGPFRAMVRTRRLTRDELRALVGSLTPTARSGALAPESSIDLAA